MNPTRIDLAVETRVSIVSLLNARLIDLIDLNMQLKQAHWNVKGPNFLSLHKLFDEISADISEFIDDVAERIVALGGVADGTIAAVAKNTSLVAYPRETTSGLEHAELIANAIAVAGRLIRLAIDQSDDLSDANTADLFTGISRKLDQSLWLVESHVQSDF